MDGTAKRFANLWPQVDKLRAASGHNALAAPTGRHPSRMHMDRLGRKPLEYFSDGQI